MPLNRTPATRPQHRMECMELWGGSHETDTTVEMTGLRAHVYSHAFGDSTRGGDVYYFSSCASGRISRVVLADITGHGGAVAETATMLRDVMRQNVNVIGQSSLMAALNQEFARIAAAGSFATAVVVTYFSPTQTVTVSIAGHPPPLLFRGKTKTWSLVADPTSAPGPSARDLPLGITDTSHYGSTSFRMAPGDRLLVYTDAFSESRVPPKEMLHSEGLRQQVSNLTAKSTAEILPELIRRLSDACPSNLTQDDATAILMEPTGQRIPLTQNLLAPWRMFRGVHEVAAGAAEPNA